MSTNVQHLKEVAAAARALSPSEEMMANSHRGLAAKVPSLVSDPVQGNLLIGDLLAIASLQDKLSSRLIMLANRVEAITSQSVVIEMPEPEEVARARVLTTQARNFARLEQLMNDLQSQVSSMIRSKQD